MEILTYTTIYRYINLIILYNTFLFKYIHVGQDQYNSITMPSEQEFQNALQLYTNCKKDEVYSFCIFFLFI